MSRQYSLGNGPPPTSRFGNAGGGSGAGQSLSPSPASRQPSVNFSSPSIQSAMNAASSGSSEDFPALSPSAAAAQGNSSLSNSLFSYASQAGQPSSATSHNGGIGGGPLPPGMSAAALLGGGAQNQREFSQDDFPALGGYPSGETGGDATTAIGSLAAGVNGMSLTSRTAAAAAAGQGQEQASALAALAAQQQHRASLLGAMNGNSPALQQAQRQAQSDKQQQQQQQPWAASPSPAPSSFPSSLLSNGNSTPASSPLPPPAASSEQPRSPTLGTGSNGGIAAALIAQAAQQRSVSSSIASNALPPPPTSTTTSATTGGPPGTSTASANASLSTPAGGQIPQTPVQQVLFSPADRFGLVGLLHIIKSANTDQGMLALGNDLTNLGLDLGAPDNLYSNFITPWSDSKTAQVLNIEPEYTLPSCYNVQPPPANTKIGSFSDETLFFIFYSQPRDAMQEMAAHELYKHNWRYHKDLKLWLTKEAGTEPVQKTATFERGSYIFFDPVLWERVRRDFILQFDQLETRRA